MALAQSCYRLLRRISLFLRRCDASRLELADGRRIGESALRRISLLAAMAAFSTWLMFLPPTANAQEQVGAVEWVKVSAFGRLQVAATWNDLSVNDSVFQNQGIRTVLGAAAHVRFVDGTYLRVGSSSEVVLDDFVYDVSPSAAKLVISFNKGLLRYVSGKMPKIGVRIVTPTSWVGVRGTDFILQVLADGTTLALVLEGEISITPRVGGDTGTLGEGETARISFGSSVIERGVTGPVFGDGLRDAGTQEDREIDKELDDLLREANAKSDQTWTETKQVPFSDDNFNRALQQMNQAIKLAEAQSFEQAQEAMQIATQAFAASARQMATMRGSNIRCQQARAQIREYGRGISLTNRYVNTTKFHRQANQNYRRGRHAMVNWVRGNC